jgi:hypothetical protein
MEKKIDFVKQSLMKEYKESWDIIAKYSDEAWFTHLYDWIEIENQWGIESQSFLVVVNGIVSGIVPLFLIKKKGFKYLKSGYKGWGGPAFLDVDVDIRKKTYDYIDLIAKETKADWIEVALPFGVNSSDLLKYGYNVTPLNTSVINLQKSITEIYYDIDKKCRYEIRKPEKMKLNINFRRALNLEDINEYHKIHVENYNRTGVPPNPAWYFENLFNRFSNEGIIQFFFIEEDKEKVAAASVAVYKGHAIYLTGSSLDEALGKGINHYLQWNIIQTLHNMGVKSYELGEIEESTDKARSLGKFKESFGGKLYAVHKGIKLYHPLKYKTYKLLQRIKSWKK